MMALSGALFSVSDAEAASITSNPSPAVSNKPLEITISGQDLGSQVYCYTWCAKIGSESKSPFAWNDVNTSRFQMTRNGDSYTFSIPDIKAFYGLSDSELENLTSLGFIAKNSNGGQTDDFFVEVVQGRRDAYSGGEGTADNPFILKTTQDFNELVSTPGDWASGTYLRLDADIDLAGVSLPVGSMGSPFSATLDGNGHTLSHVSASGSGLGSATGLFACLKGATVKNLGLTGVSVTGTTYVGALAGYMESGLIERCFAQGTVKGSSISVGGLVGENVAGEILDCYATVNVENVSDYATGGLVGKNCGRISNTYAAGKVEGFDYVGGLVGANYGIVRNSLALNSEITSYNDFAARFGGNNNSRNFGENNYSWDSISKGHPQWASHGDHADMRGADILRDEQQFKSLTGWNFSNVWEWKKEGTKEYPVLAGISNQACPLSDVYFSISSSIYDLDEGEAVIYAGPNPTAGPVKIHASNGIGSYAVYSVSGQTICSGAPHAQTVEVDLSAYPAALYIVAVADTDGNKKVIKIIKN
ncbi:MAG: T9SS type A sorting domain-containing protein [Muribaculaceae bacterium]|nr:T9SS type A sorting domain-containing protein [Muribaculaceae bacterium]